MKKFIDYNHLEQCWRYGYVNAEGKRIVHRENDKPAVLSTNGTVFLYYKHGVLHRMYGPAAKNKITNKNLWYINGYHVTVKIKEWAKERNIDLYNLTDFDKNVINVEWCDYYDN